MWSYGTALLPGLVGFFTFFIVKTEENLELEVRLEIYFVHVFTCIESDLLWKQWLPLLKKYFSTWLIHCLHRFLMPLCHMRMTCIYMFFKFKQESNIWSVACAELSSTKTCKPFTRNDYCRGRIRSRNRAAALADRCLNFCSEKLYRHYGSSFQKPGFL